VRRRSPLSKSLRLRGCPIEKEKREIAEVKTTARKVEGKRRDARNFIDGQDGSKEDPHKVQTLRTPLLPCQKEGVLKLRIRFFPQD
jgi:hypothetical protein